MLSRLEIHTLDSWSTGTSSANCNNISQKPKKIPPILSTLIAVYCVPLNPVLYPQMYWITNSGQPGQANQSVINPAQQYKGFKRGFYISLS